MPTYQYACKACDERLEAVQRFTDAPLAECPVCGGELRKVFSAVGVVFKGSGFYKNDSRESAAKKTAKPKEGAVASSSSTSSDVSSSSSSSSSSDSSSSGSGGSGGSGGSRETKAPAATAKTPAKAPVGKTA